MVGVTVYLLIIQLAVLDYRFAEVVASSIPVVSEVSLFMCLEPRLCSRTNLATLFFMIFLWEERSCF